MSKATQQDIRAFSQTCKAQIQAVTNFRFGMIDPILHPALYIAMAIFFWIEFWCIRWQVLSMNFWMLCQISLDQIRPMCSRAIPDQNEWSVYVSSDMFQANNQFLRIDRAIKMSFVNLAGDCQSHHGRCLPTIFRDPLDLWRLAFGCPGKAYSFCIGQPKLIFKYDLCVETLRFFLSWANPGPTKPGSVLHRARWRVGLVFVHSSLNHATTG